MSESQSDYKTKFMFFTINNYTDKTVSMVKELACTACVCGKEVGKKTLTPHLQGCVIWKSANTWKQAQKKLCESGKCFTELKKGTWAQNMVYCRKEGDVIREDEYVEGPGQGSRTDIIGLRDAVKRKATDAELCDEYPNECAKYQRFIGFCRAAYNEAEVVELPRGNKQLGVWLWGPSNTGKTTWVRDQYPDLYEKPHNRWWDGYNNEDVILIDDPPRHGNKPEILWDNLKTWVQEKPFRAQQEVGGKQRKMRFKEVWVTANYSPEEYFGVVWDESIFRTRFQIHKIETKLYSDFIGPVRELAE